MVLPTTFVGCPDHLGLPVRFPRLLQGLHPSQHLHRLRPQRAGVGVHRSRPTSCAKQTRLAQCAAIETATEAGAPPELGTHPRRLRPEQPRACRVSPCIARPSSARPPARAPGCAVQSQRERSVRRLASNSGALAVAESRLGAGSTVRCEEGHLAGKRQRRRERERNDLFKALEFLQIPEELELPAVLHTQTKQQRLKIVSVHRDPYWHLSTSPALLLSPLLPLPLLPPPVLAPAPAPA